MRSSRLIRGGATLGETEHDGSAGGGTWLASASSGLFAGCPVGAGARFRSADGRLVSAPRTFKAKGEAARWLAGAESDQARGIWLDPAAGRISRPTTRRPGWAGSQRSRRAPERSTSCSACAHPARDRRRDCPGVGTAERADACADQVVVRSVGRSVWQVGRREGVRAARQILGQAVNDDRIAKNPVASTAAASSDTPSSGSSRLLSSTTSPLRCPTATGAC